jgi:hypothetical protein
MRERGKGDAEEADFAFGIAMVAEEIEEDGEDVGIELGGFGIGFGAGVSIEACVADGKGESARGEAGFAKALAGFLGEVTEHSFHFGEVEGVCAERVIVGDGFGFGVDEEFIGIAAARFAVESGAPLAKDFFEFFLGVGGELFDGFDAEGAKGALGDFADARNFADRERCEEAGFHAGCDPDQAAGFALIRGDFGGEACGREAAGAGKTSLLRDGAEEFVGRGEGWAMEAFGAGEIEVGFVDGDHFDDGGKSGEDGGHAIAPFRIFFVVAIEENGMGAEAAGGAERHGGVDAELACFVAGGGDNAALVGAAADYNGLAAEVGSVEQFDGDEESVHVHVEDGGVKRRLLLFSGGMFCAEAGEVGHGTSVTCRDEVFNEMLFPARIKEIDDCRVVQALMNRRRG